MSAKRKDEQNRWRNKVVAFRMSPEEAQQLDVMVKLANCSKQQYIVSKLLDRTVVVQGNPRIYKALSQTLDKVLEELKLVDTPSNDLLTTIRQLTTVMEGLKGGEMQ